MNASEEMLRRAEDTAKMLREVNKRLRTRIAKLKWQLEELSTRDITEDLNAYLAGEGVCITGEQVDAAWSRCGDDDFERDDGTCVITRWIPADDLGIVACEECGGTGKITEIVAHGRIPAKVSPCPGCYRNGKSHGWVWQP